MAKRSIGAAIILAALLLVCSCDPESFLRAFGTNVLGGTNSGKVVEDLDEMLSNNSIEYGKIVELVKTARTPDAEKALIDKLSEKASTELVENSADIVRQIDEMDQLTDLSDEDIESLDVSQAIKDNLHEAVAALKKIQEGLDSSSDADADYKITNGDICIIQTIKTAYDTLRDDLNGESLSQEDISSLIDKANESLKVFTTIKSSTAFRNVNINAVINELVSSMNQSGDGEGGEA